MSSQSKSDSLFLSPPQHLLHVEYLSIYPVRHSRIEPLPYRLSETIAASRNGCFFSLKTKKTRQTSGSNFTAAILAKTEFALISLRSVSFPLSAFRFQLFSFDHKCSLVSATITPLSTISEIKFGSAMSPLVMSAKLHTIFSDATDPTNTIATHSQR